MQNVATHSPTVNLYDPASTKAATPSIHTSKSFELKIEIDNKIQNQDLIPYWVDEEYLYDPSNPRKPNMRELIEALSGQKVEDLYADPESNVQHYSKQAADMLYGVLGGASDTRDWVEIMSSIDIVSAATGQTAMLHEPYVDIQSTYEKIELTDGTVAEILTAQFPVLKSKKNNVLTTSLTSNSSKTIDELNRFGGKRINFSSSILNKIEHWNFDFKSFHVIRDYLEDTLL